LVLPEPWKKGQRRKDGPLEGGKKERVRTDDTGGKSLFSWRLKGEFPARPRKERKKAVIEGEPRCENNAEYSFRCPAGGKGKEKPIRLSSTITKGGEGRA